jgi:asparagine synthase (glutamine-hydrolysing)
MAESVAHRGRGAYVVHESEHATFAVRAARPDLADRLGSAALHADGDLALAFAGHLTGADFACSSLADVAARFRVRGADCVAELRGAFVLAISDGARLFLVRDGAGVRTLYWGLHAGRLLFAVEPKGVLVAPGFPRRLRPAAIAQFLSTSFVPGERTMLEDLFELCPGHRLELDAPRGEPRIHRFFVFENETQAQAERSDEEWVREFQTLFSRAVAERRTPGEPVGVFLSGGLDSSVVTAELAGQHDARVHTYAVHFGSEYPNELPFARAVAERCGTLHQEVRLRPKDFLPRLRRIIWHLDDPIGDPITVPNFELAARVSSEVRSVYNGEGGDPLFGGPKNIPMLLHHWYGGIERDAGFRARMYLAAYRRSYEEWPRLLTPAWASRVSAERDLEGVFSSMFDAEQPGTFLNKLCAINIRTKGGHLILPKVDRMAGASALVPLAPLFDERLVRLSFRVPPRLKLETGVEKVLMKRAFVDRLPLQVLGRPKSGMRVPVHFWLQGEMKRYARKVLARRELERAGIFDPDRVARLLAYDTEEGPGRYGLRLWMLLTFEIWRRIVVEGEPV